MRPFVRTTAIVIFAVWPATVNAQTDLVVGEWTGGGQSYIFESNGDFTEIYYKKSIESARYEGAWQSGIKTCWITVSDEKEYGNLMTFLGSNHCCFNAFMVGSRLVLSAVNPSFGCSNKTLSRKPGGKSQQGDAGKHFADVPLSKGTVQGVQSDLTALGYKPGPADGILGPQTGNAIKAFQRDQGVLVTGEASEKLRVLLLMVLEKKRRETANRNPTKVELSD